MTPDQASTATASRIENTQTQSRTPALVVRISAIGDTLIAARTQGQLYSRGYAPVLVTHKNNAALLNCMPLLQGACLISDQGPEFLWQQGHNQKLDHVSENDFLLRLRETLQKSDPRQNQNNLKLSVLDLQHTGRSVRAIRELEPRLARAGLKIETHKVAKLTFWRLLLVFLSFFARSQKPGREFPIWLQRRLKPVHQLQRELVQTLPVVALNAQSNPSQVLIAPTQTDANNPNGHVVFLVGASLRLKSWPKENYRALQSMILERTAFSVVLCGGPEDVRVGEYLAFPEHERIINKIGKTTLAETLSLIRTAKYVVTGDSFASHAADLLGTPASVMFGSTHPLLGFAPQGAHVNVHHAALACSPCSRHGQGECRFKNIRCLTSIKPEEVFSKIEHISKAAGQRADTLRQSSDS